MITHLPESIDPVILKYMCSNHFGKKSVIPIWNPSQTIPRDAGRRLRPQKIDVGDIGHFTEDGDFIVAFNIFVDSKTNDDWDYKTPPHFENFSFPFFNKIRDFGGETKSDENSPSGLGQPSAVEGKEMWDKDKVLPLGFQWSIGSERQAE